MDDSETRAAAMLARADVVQARLSGLILSVLIERGLLTPTQAQAILDDAASHLHEDDPMNEVYDGLKREFR